MTNNLRDSANRTFVTSDDTFPLTVFESFVAMLMPPQGSLDVGPAPCVAGSAGFGYAPACSVVWRTLSFQFFTVCAATMALVKSEYMMLEMAPWLAGIFPVLTDNDFKKLEPRFAAFDGVISVKAAAAFAGKCVWTCSRISKESKRTLFFLKNDGKDGRRKGRKGERKRKRKNGVCPLIL